MSCEAIITVKAFRDSLMNQSNVRNDSYASQPFYIGKIIIILVCVCYSASNFLAVIITYSVIQLIEDVYYLFCKHRYRLLCQGDFIAHVMSRVFLQRHQPMKLHITTSFITVILKYKSI